MARSGRWRAAGVDAESTAFLRFRNFAHGDLRMCLRDPWGGILEAHSAALTELPALSLGPLPTAQLGGCPKLRWASRSPACWLSALDLGGLRPPSTFWAAQKAQAGDLCDRLARRDVRSSTAIVRFIIGVDDHGASPMASAFDHSRSRRFREMTGLDEGLAFRTSQGITIVVALICMGAAFLVERLSFNRHPAPASRWRAFSDHEDLALAVRASTRSGWLMITWLIVAGARRPTGGCAVAGSIKSFQSR